jgi:DNA-binding HxlR family transcriptional regulator
MKKHRLPLDVFSPNCPARQVINRVADKWTILVFLALKDGSMRFNELRRLLQNVSQKMLTQTLRKLEEDGFVTRHVVPTVPVTVSYELTPLGESLLAVVDQLRTWAYSHIPEIERARERKAKRFYELSPVIANSRSRRSAAREAIGAQI